MAYTITERNVEAKPILIVRRTVTYSEIAKTIGEAYGVIGAYMGAKGLQIAGPPITRYPAMQPPNFTVEPGLPVASADGLTNEGEVMVDSLCAGTAAVTLHVGPYEKLSEAFSALQEWMQANGVHPAGAPWEEYLNDPGVVKDPAKFETVVYWPIGR